MFDLKFYGRHAENPTTVSFLSFIHSFFLSFRFLFLFCSFFLLSCSSSEIRGGRTPARTNLDLEKKMSKRNNKEKIESKWWTGSRNNAPKNDDNKCQYWNDFNRPGMRPRGHQKKWRHKKKHEKKTREKKHKLRDPNCRSVVNVSNGKDGRGWGWGARPPPPPLRKNIYKKRRFPIGCRQQAPFPIRRHVPKTAGTSPLIKKKTSSTVHKTQ